MEILKTATEWAKDEVFSSLFFILFGIVFVLATLGFWQLGKTDIARAFIFPVFGTDLRFNNVSVENYEKERKAALGEFIGTVIAGIYEGIKNGANEVPSQFEKVAGRPHKTPLEMMEDFKNSIK